MMYNQNSTNCDENVYNDWLIRATIVIERRGRQDAA